MEKLIYVLVGSAGPGSEAPNPEATRGELSDRVVSVARGVGGRSMAVLSPDKTDEIRSRCAARIGGAFDSLAAVFECWMPSLDDRGAIEEALAPLAGEVWGYLVTESIPAPCPHEVEDGARVPGITQWGINDKPAKVSLEDFYHEWQVVHSRHSFDLHPHRDSYARNAVARRLTPKAPSYLAIVLERFPSLDVFVDESRYFGAPEVVQEMFAHVPSFYDFETAITGGMSEFRFA